MMLKRMGKVVFPHKKLLLKTELQNQKYLYNSELKCISLFLRCGLQVDNCML